MEQMRNNEYPVEFVSLGPGDPELITLKGWRTLREAHVIFCPATRPEGASKAADIVRSLGIENRKIRLYNLPMSRDRSDARQAYSTLREEIKRLRAEGLRVAVTAEGDAGFYSSTHDICSWLRNEGIDWRQIPGVPAFIAAGAEAGLHVVSQDERLTVLPGTTDGLAEAMERGDAVVIMKLSACAEAVHHYLREHPETNCHYFERLGMPNEFHTSNPQEIQDRAFPYFSLLLLIPARNPFYDRNRTDSIS